MRKVVANVLIGLELVLASGCTQGTIQPPEEVERIGVYSPVTVLSELGEPFESPAFKMFLARTLQDKPEDLQLELFYAS